MFLVNDLTFQLIFGLVEKKMKNKRSKDQNILFTKSFEALPDPRRTDKGNFLYPLIEVVFLVISSVLSNADDWSAISMFGKSQLDWLRKFFPYKNGTPSHDALGELFASIDHEKFNECFVEWVKSLQGIIDEDIIAIDGKRLCGSYDKSSSKAAIHMVSAFGAENGICLGQKLTDTKSNEITAIPKLLEILELKDSTVTIDAMGCQKEIVEQVKAKGADYVIAVKENQKELFAQVKKMFEINQGATSQEADSGHGRVESRKCTVIDQLGFLDIKDQWTGLKSVIKIETERTDKLNGNTQKQIRYYISSCKADAQRLNYVVRKHWAIENQLHWVLDVTFNEDASRRRLKNAASNFNIVLKIVMAILKKDTDKKTSLAKKRYKAALNCNYREQLLKT